MEKSKDLQAKQQKMEESHKEQRQMKALFVKLQKRHHYIKG